MTRWFYDLAFFIFGIFSLPHFLMRLRQAENPGRLLKERFGLFSPEFLSRWGGERPLWIHGVSVGEVLSVEKFVELLLERKPSLRVVLTTVTPTGQQVARKWEGERLSVAYFPFDFRASVRRFFKILKPAALLLVETEIWPNVIEEARRQGVPMGVMNGRISERSFRAFRRFSAIFRPLLRNIDFFLVQTEGDRERLVRLGVDPERVKVTGNMKLDAFDTNGHWQEGRELLRRRWGFLPSDQILIGGSTHAGEEKILLHVLRLLREEGFPLKLLLAPRHIERAPEILALAQREKLKAVLASRRDEGRSSSDLPFEVLILNQLGKLRTLYAIADVVLMGGSLVPHGGQNPIEPARFARPILHGPWVFNFEAIYQRLEEEGASLGVHGEEELLFALKRLLASEVERNHLGNRAYEVLEKLRGATERNFNWVNQWLTIGTTENEKLHKS